MPEKIDDLKKKEVTIRKNHIVNGRVIVHETSTPIPNAVVTVYNVAESITSGKQALTPEIIMQKGKSLGSVLTNPDGSFEIPIDDLSKNDLKEFRLATVVTSGEISSDGKEGNGAARSKVLSYTAQTKTGIGTKEVFQMRIQRKHIEDNDHIPGIILPPLPPKQKKLPSREEIIKEIKAAQRFVPVPKSKIDKKDYALNGRALEIYNRAKKHDVSLTDKSVETIQKEIITNTLKGLEYQHQKAIAFIKGEKFEDESETPSVIPRTIEINLSEKAADKIKDAAGAGGEFAIMHFKDFKNFLPSTNMTAPKNSTTHFLKGDVPEPDNDTTDPQEDSAAIEIRAVANIGAETDSSDDKPPTKEEFLRNKIAGLLEKMHANDGDNTEDVEEVLEETDAAEEQTQNTTDNETRLGELQSQSAADAIAYHDFYDLKIAWQPIWSEVLEVWHDSYGLVPVHVKDFLPSLSQDQWLDFRLEMDKLNEDWTDIERSAVEYLLWNEYLKILQGTGINELYINELKELAISLDYSNGNLRNPMHNANYLQNVWDENHFQELPSYVNEVTKKKDDLHLEWSNKIDQLTSATAVIGSQSVFARDTEDKGYEFKVFAKDSVNYGLLINYRQQWRPEIWQVGDLVETIPLAPKESRKYTKKVKVSKKRSQKEVENSQSIRRSEDATTMRADREIIERAQANTGFKQNIGGNFNFKMGDIGGGASSSTTFDTSSANDSSDTKKKFRESVAKSAREYKEEHKLEITTDDTAETEFTSTNEISNPNEEITVTYLFYELERCFDVFERLHKVQAVLLVANEVPEKSDLDTENWEWIFRHDWILKRFLLDDSFRPALDFVLEGKTAMDSKVTQLGNKKESIQGIVDSIKTQIGRFDQTLSATEIEMEANAEILNNLTGTDNNIIDDISHVFLGGDPGAQIEEQEQKLEQAAEKLDRIGQKLKGKRDELVMQRSALDRAVDAYNNAVQERDRKQRHVKRLIKHLQDNILYYMQAIWSHEPPDQRYLRLFDKEVEFIEYPADDADVMIRVRNGIGTLDDFIPGSPFEIIMPPPAAPVKKRLVEIADLDNLLGFKGNYMIFPLRQQSYLTAYMAQSFVGDYYEELPDNSASSMSMQDIIAQQNKLSFNGAKTAFDPDKEGAFETNVVQAMHDLGWSTNEIEAKLDEFIKKGLMDPESKREKIIVPSQSLYIEALPGKHALLEDFKLKHREIDMRKAEAELLEQKLENVRAEARLWKLDFDDPEIDKRVVIEGKNVSVSANDVGTEEAVTEAGGGNVVAVDPGDGE